MGSQTLCIIETEKRQKINPRASVFERHTEHNDNQIIARLPFFNPSLLTAQKFFLLLPLGGGVIRKRRGEEGGCKISNFATSLAPAD